MTLPLSLLAQTPATPAPDPLQLRDVHLPEAPPLWPPAPGWWLVLAAVLVLLAFLAWRRLQRRRWERGMAVLFDATVDAAQPTTTARVAAISELLRRASRLRDPAADRLAGEAWLTFLDAGERQPVFTGPVARTLLEGAFRPGTTPADCEALRVAARVRFVQLMRPSPWWRRRWRRGA